MSVSTPIPSSVTCFKNGLSHFTFPVNFRPGLSPNKIGPLTPNTVNGSISVIPNDTNLKIYSITSENNLMIKVHYKLENQDQEGKANFFVHQSRHQMDTKLFGQGERRGQDFDNRRKGHDCQFHSIFG